MALFDFMQRGKSSEAPAQAAKETSSPSVSNLPDSVKAQAVEAGKGARGAIDSLKQNPRPENTSPNGQADGKEALMHNQSGAGKTQEALSPTDSHKGNAQSQSRSRGWER